MRRLWILLVLIVGLGDLSPAQFQYMRTHFIDVGQGNAILLEFPCGAALIDAGGKDETTDSVLYEYLDRFFDRRTDLHRTIDVLFVTHTHTDHNRALRRLVEDAGLGFTVKRYVHNGLLNGSGSPAAKFMDENAAALGIDSRAVSVSAIRGLPERGGLTDPIIDPIACAGIDPQLRVLFGQMDIEDEWTPGALNNGNNHSLVIRVDFGEASFLFVGDLEEEGIETLLDYYGESHLLDVDVYQVGHHGSYNGTTPEFLTAITPRLAVISMSPWNDRRPWTAWAYGHPRSIVVDELVTRVSRSRTTKSVRVATAVKKFKAYTMRKAIFATGWDGNVVVFARSDGRLTVRTYD